MITKREKQLTIELLKERIERISGKKVVLKEDSEETEKIIKEGEEKVYTIVCERDNGKDVESTGTLAQLIKDFSYTLKTGESYQHEKGNKKININPKTISQLITNLNNAVNNAAANGYAGKRYNLK